MSVVKFESMHTVIVTHRLLGVGGMSFCNWSSYC